jgi:hypothetical protein
VSAPRREGPHRHRSTCGASDGLTPRIRQTRASVLARSVLAPGPIQKSRRSPPRYWIHEVPAALTSVIEHVDPAAPDAKRPPSRRRRRSCSWLVSDRGGHVLRSFEGLRDADRGAARQRRCVCSLGFKPILSKRADCRSPADGRIHASGGVAVEKDDQRQSARTVCGRLHLGNATVPRTARTPRQTVGKERSGQPRAPTRHRRRHARDRSKAGVSWPTRQLPLRLKAEQLVDASAPWPGAVAPGLARSRPGSFLWAAARLIESQHCDVSPETSSPALLVLDHRNSDSSAPCGTRALRYVLPTWSAR